MFFFQTLHNAAPELSIRMRRGIFLLKSRENNLRHSNLEKSPVETTFLSVLARKQPQHVYLAHHAKIKHLIDAVLVVTPPITHQIVVLPILFRPLFIFQPEIAVPFVDCQKYRTIHSLEASFKNFLRKCSQIITSQRQCSYVAKTGEDILVDLTDFIVIKQH